MSTEQWLTDARGNKSSVEYFGSVEAAQAALDSLKNCDNCINCSDCSRCSDCSDCSRCSDCSDCSHCSHCSHCSRCSDCSDCSRCSDCSDCSNCSGCSNCSYCSYCSNCSNCSNCSYCSNCSDCSDCSYCSGKTGDFVPPSVPKIDNIHQRIFEAVSAPQALDMDRWHTCNTTHCRAGWVVHLAGEAGYALERYHTTALAAQLIYRESGYAINPCRFYDGNTAAMEDMRKLAEESDKSTLEATK